MSADVAETNSSSSRIFVVQIVLSTKERPWLGYQNNNHHGLLMRVWMIGRPARWVKRNQAAC